MPLSCLGYNRGMNERSTKRRGPLGWMADRSWRFWAIAAVLVPVLYVLSSGPAAYILDHASLSASTDRILTDFYRPLRFAVMRPSIASRAWYRYVSLWIKDEALAENGSPVGILYSPSQAGAPPKLPLSFGSPPPK